MFVYSKEIVFAQKDVKIVDFCYCFVCFLMFFAYNVLLFFLDVNR